MRLLSLPDALPLLTKELTEQSARRRTYFMRTVYLTCLFGGAGLVFYDLAYSRLRGSPLAMLGAGRDLFMSLMAFQVFGIYLVIPLISSGLITSEKERDSLSLLFLTRLGPWAIVFEKLLSRLVPLCLFVLGSLPLMGIAYSLGGVTSEMLASAIWTLVITSFQCTALSLMCSAWCRSTAAAFFMTLVLGFAFIGGPPFLDEMRLIDFDPIRTGGGIRIETEFLMMGPYLFLGLAEQHGFAVCFLASGPLVLSGIVFLILARVFLVGRAFASSTQWLKRGFQAIDAVARNVLPRGVFELLARDSQDLPDNAPVAWRETARSLTGSTRYQFYIFVLTMMPLLFLCLWISNSGESTYWAFDMFVSIHFLLWMAVALAVCVKGASLFSSEHTRQTFDVLMTTPMTTREILRQKMSSLRNLVLFVLLLLLTLFLFESFWRQDLVDRSSRGGHYGVRHFEMSTYLACCFLTAVIYLPIVAWGSVAIGLRFRSHARAIFAAVIALVIWCLGPVVSVAILATLLRVRVDDEVIWVMLSSPATIIPFNEFSDLDDFADATIIPVLVNAGFHAILLGFVRAWCLHTADAAIGRSVSSREL